MAKIFNFFKREPITLTGQTTEEWVKMFKRRFNIDNYKGKYVMHCKTEKEAKDFCNFLHYLGRKWCTSDSYISKTNWEMYKKNTCYNFNEGSYASIEWYLEKKYTILEWEDFMEKKSKEYTAIGNYQRFRKENLENNDIVTFQNGERGIVFIELESIVTEDLNGYVRLSSYTSELTNSQAEDWDIVKVQRANYIHHFMKSRWDDAPVIWEREETVEMTLAEVCKALGKNVKIVKE